MTIDKRLVLRATQRMIDRFGDEALTEVNLRITELRARGEHEAEDLWKEIREAVLYRTRKPEKGSQH